MKKCRVCGASLDDDAVFCTECGSKITDSENDAPVKTSIFGGNGSSAGHKNASSSVPFGDVASSTDSRDVVLAENEQIVRTYLVSRNFLPGVFGSLIITNKRVIFYADNESSKSMMSMPLSSVDTVTMHYGVKNFLLVVAGAVALVYAIFCFTARYKNIQSGIIFTLIAAALLFYGLRKTIVLSLGAKGSVLELLCGKSTSFTLQSGAGPEAEKAVTEIGACILDLQQKGDDAIKKWEE